MHTHGRGLNCWVLLLRDSHFLIDVFQCRRFSTVFQSQFVIFQEALISPPPASLPPYSLTIITRAKQFCYSMCLWLSNASILDIEDVEYKVIWLAKANASDARNAGFVFGKGSKTFHHDPINHLIRLCSCWILQDFNCSFPLLCGLAISSSSLFSSSSSSSTTRRRQHQVLASGNLTGAILPHPL